MFAGSVDSGRRIITNVANGHPFSRQGGEVPEAAVPYCWS
jgi:hypothetical protein